MINRLADRIEEALRRDATGRLPALPIPLPEALTPLRLPSLEPDYQALSLSTSIHLRAATPALRW
ncbi:hypothetical protein EBU60_04755 [bacterium]|nr:hypothetical protein [bacterium]